MSRTCRFLRKMLFIFLAVFTLTAFFYAEEDWRGAHAWSEVRRQLEGRGESFDPAAYIPAPVPDAENLAMAPLFARLFRYQVDPQTHVLTFGPSTSAFNPTYKLIEDMPGGKDIVGLHTFKGLFGWNTAARTDLAAWQQYYRQHKDFPHAPDAQAPADDVLLALTRYAPVLDELAHEAAARPRTRFPVNWGQLPPWNIAIPQYSLLSNLSKTLHLRAVAALATGHQEDALRDVELIFRLRRAAGDDPVLIGTLVDITQTGLLLQPVWEGLADRRWTAVELDRLSEGLRGIDFLSEYQRSIRGGERLFLCVTMDELKRHGQVSEFLNLITRMSNPAPGVSLWNGPQSVLLPGGWFDQNKAVGCRVFQEAILDPVHPEVHRVEVERSVQCLAAQAKAPSTAYNFMVKTICPVFDNLLRKIARSQAAVDEALTACALEKYALDHQAYPEDLSALVPAYCERVPVDVIDGAPLRYRRTKDGRYLLWSVGWNERDDGGKPGKGISNPDAAEEGDWVWQYPPVRSD